MPISRGLFISLTHDNIPMSIRQKSKMKTKTVKTSSKSIFNLRILSLAVVLSVFVAASFYVPFVRADQYDDKINALKADNNQKKASQAQLGAEASGISDQIGKLQAEINAVQSKINANEAEMGRLQGEIKAAEDELARQKDLLGQTIKAMYLEGDISTVEMLATSKDLSDFFDKQQYRESVRSKIKTTLDKITQLKLDLNTQKETVTKLLAEQKGLRGQLASQKAENDNLLSLNQSQQGALNSQIQANSAKMNELKAQQAIAYAAYARRSGVTVYGGSAGNGGYPSVWANAPQDSMIDSWGGYNRECVSYVAWKIASQGRYVPYGLGNAADWPSRARSKGIAADSNASVGSAVVWESNDGLGYLGHVAYVESVNGDRSLEVSQYNFVHGRFNRMHVPASDAGRLTYIHF